jgi:peptidoglycan/LPS O-acetylase OafA/YrhL
VNIAANPDTIIKLDYKWMSYLGKISYGIYLYSPIMRIFGYEFTKNLYHSEISGWAMNLTLYAFSIFSTILVAVLSYEFFEKFFLRKKKKLIPV